jgi:hypothetical protein
MGNVSPFTPSFASPNSAPPVEPGPPIDPLAAWRALPPAMQEQLGAAVVAFGVATLGTYLAEEDADPVAHAAHYAAAAEAMAVIEVAVVAGVLGGCDGAPPPWVDLRPLGVRQCTGCGCTDDHGCREGCSWIAADRCSQCGPAGVP